MTKLTTRSGLMTSATFGSALLASMVAGLATPAGAQTTTNSDTQAKKDASPVEVVVTGSMIRKKNATSISPVTVLTATDLDKRGVTTVESAVQNLSANNSGALPNSFTANGAFAGGASGASLRGLTTSSTLTLVDGMRMTYYPLADDGSRNFVDMNTIPDAIIDHIDVLQDGASATYGADAIGGVINVVTKRQFTGLEIKADAGTSELGGADKHHLSGIWGTGDLGSDGYNFYVSGEYQHDSQLMNRDRGYPYNTADVSGLCSTEGWEDGKAHCGTNAISNGFTNGVFVGLSTFDTNAIVRPYDATNTTAQGLYQNISPTTTCQPGMTSHTMTAAELTAAGTAGASLTPGTVLCQADAYKLYRTIIPADSRLSFSAHLTKRFNDTTEGWIEGNFYQNKTFYTTTPANIRVSSQPGSTFVDTTLALPVWVCPERTGCSTAADKKLNPNNPFAASNQVARILYATGDIPKSAQTISKTMRVAGGLKGSFGDGWRYDAGFTASSSSLTITRRGFPYIQHLLDVIADGTYNFIDPTKNTQAVRDYLSPVAIQKAKSSLAMAQFNVSKDLWELPGGTMSLGLGASERYEGVNDPSANPFSGGPNAGYLGINPFFSKGQRTVASASYELEMPVLKQLDINFQGRYDNYSTKNSHFSPKLAAKWKFNDMLMFRGTYSNGFRIPSIAENNSSVTGYTTVNAPASFITAHGNDTYGKSYSLGTVTAGNPNLKPETATNTLLGFVFTPDKSFNVSVDYFHIEKKHVIAKSSSTPALNAYYGGTAIPAGYTVVADVPDSNFPNALPRVAYVYVPFLNQNKQVVSGMDFNASYHAPVLNGKMVWTSTITATYLGQFDQTQASGEVQHFAGTVGPQDPTAGSGSPRMRANWQNTFDFGKLSLSTTSYYTSGYSETAADNGDKPFLCLGSATASIACQVKSFLYTDAHAQYQVNKTYTLFLDVSNVTGAKAPLDSTSYSAHEYNPVWAGAGVIGRYWKIGVKADF